MASSRAGPSRQVLDLSDDDDDDALQDSFNTASSRRNGTTTVHGGQYGTSNENHKLKQARRNSCRMT